MREALAERDGHHVGDVPGGEHGGDPEDRPGVEVRRPRPDPTRPAEGRAAVAVVDEVQDVRTDGHGQHEDQGDRSDERRPGEERCPVQAHARSPCREHGGGDRCGDGGQAGEDEDVAAEVQLDHLRVTAEWPAVEGEGDDDQHEPGEPAPQSSRGETREGERSGADLQGNDEDADPEQQRQDGTLDESHPERREELAVVVDVEQRRVPVDSFDPEDDSDGGNGEQAEE